jgi:hypothetical protein
MLIMGGQKSRPVYGNGEGPTKEIFRGSMLVRCRERWWWDVVRIVAQLKYAGKLTVSKLKERAGAWV